MSADEDLSRARIAVAHTPLRRAVGQALGTHRQPGSVLALGVLAGIAAYVANAAPEGSFPAVIELASLDGTNGFTLNGVKGRDLSGISVSSAGDVNGDGIGDLVIGAIHASPIGRHWAGASYVVFGRATGFPATFELRSLNPPGGDGSAGFVLKGIDSSDYSGGSVSSAGDVNDDGIDDLIIGASGAGSSSESYVVFGRNSFPPVYELSRLHPDDGGDGSVGFVLEGAASEVSDAGDLNGDGIDDLVVGNTGADPGDRYSAGETYIVYGHATTFPATFAVRSLYPSGGGDGSAGFILRGIYDGDASGGSLSAAGDVNGDGIDDLLISAEKANPNGRRDAGECYVVFGRTTGFPAAADLSGLHPDNGGDGSAGFILEGITVEGKAGSSASGAGDINNDGIDDVIIGAPHAWANGRRSGASYVVYGRTTGFPGAFDLASLDPQNGGDGSAGFIVEGADATDYAGESVSRAGDVNGDSIDDLIIGAPGVNNDTGETYLVFGRAAGFPPIFDLGSLRPQGGGDGSAGFILQGAQFGGGYGLSVSNAGDVNGDGVDDVIIGAQHAAPDGRTRAGSSYVVFGRGAPAGH